MTDRLPELMALLGIIGHHRQQLGGFSDGPCPDLNEPDPAQRVEDQSHALAFFAQKVVPFEPDVVKKKFRMRGADQAHHQLVAAQREAGRVFVHQKQRDAL